MINILPILNLPIIKQGDNIGKLICQALQSQKIKIHDDDVIVVTHVIVSRAEGMTVNLKDISPSNFAKIIAEEVKKDPALIEVILREAKSIIRMEQGHLITETKHGFICANSGVDKSNVPGETMVTPLPENPDRSAAIIRNEIKKISEKDVAIIISDTHGRALRRGQINVAIGISGMKPIFDRRGEKDIFGYELHAKQIAVADELASAAELIIGQADEEVPAALIRGYKYSPSNYGKIKELIWPKNKALFY